MTRRQRLASRRKACGYSQERLAQLIGVDPSTVRRWEKGTAEPQPWHRPHLCRALDTTAAELQSLLSPAPLGAWSPIAPVSDTDDLDALELARRVQASDVGEETLSRLGNAADLMATKYPRTPPDKLLTEVRRYSSYVAVLFEKRATLGERQRLLDVAGWLSLLAATLHIDLQQQRAATARLRTAALLAQQSQNREIHAWTYETEAWRVLTDGDYTAAVELSLKAQEIAPRKGSAIIQATAQEGRARARLGQSRETYDAIERVRNLSSSIDMRHQPEHHYQYDPAKALSYTATTLAWLGDPAAEKSALEVIQQLTPDPDMTKWPRRVASAHLDLALSLLSGDRLDEACSHAKLAILSGRVVPSNHWRALEVVRTAEVKQLPEARDLREAYQGMRPAVEP
jgi:transcriptional regulator with XRE-family HTH domain